MRKVVDIGLLIPATLTQAINDVVKVAETSILRLAKLTQVIEEVMDVGQVRPATMPLVMAVDMLIYVDLGQNIPDTLTLAIK